MHVESSLDVKINLPPTETSVRPLRTLNDKVLGNGFGAKWMHSVLQSINLPALRGSSLTRLCFGRSLSLIRGCTINAFARNGEWHERHYSAVITVSNLQTAEWWIWSSCSLQNCLRAHIHPHVVYPQLRESHSASANGRARTRPTY